MQWFTADGFFVPAPFQQWLASNIDMVGDADPKNVSDGAAGLVSAQSVQPEGLQDLLNVINTGPPAAAPRKRG
jgi:signal peptidase complex subunit 2